MTRKKRLCCLVYTLTVQVSVQEITLLGSPSDVDRLCLFDREDEIYGFLEENGIPRGSLVLKERSVKKGGYVIVQSHASDPLQYHRMAFIVGYVHDVREDDCSVPNGQRLLYWLQFPETVGESESNSSSIRD